MPKNKLTDAWPKPEITIQTPDGERYVIRRDTETGLIELRERLNDGHQGAQLFVDRDTARDLAFGLLAVTG